MNEQISLYYRDGGSDKVYHVQLVEADGKVAVNYQYGRRGSTLQSGTKIVTPDGVQAKVIYDRLVAEKKAKGYTEGEDGTPYQGNVDKQTSGLVPQLLNVIDEERLKQLGVDDDWMMQEKKDGERRMVRKTMKDGVVTVIGSNRKGIITPIPMTIEGRVKTLPGEFVLDGEAVGDRYYVFDALEINGTDLRPLPALERYNRLKILFGIYRWQYYPIEVVDAAVDTPTKRNMYVTLREAKAEGVVFKKKDAPYVPGRPASGGNQLKFKFTQSATCYVREVNAAKGKRSVEIGMRNGEEFVAVGNVTIPANAAVPQEGQLIEVRYLYAYPGGSLYQPVFLGVRNDLDGGADDIKTLKLKQAQEDDEV